MLTFEKVFEVFREYLDADDEFEIVKTRRGYTVLNWDDMGCDWYGVHLCSTPETLRDAVLSAYGTFLEYEIIKGRGYDLTRAEKKSFRTNVPSCLHDVNRYMGPASGLAFPLHRKEAVTRRRRASWLYIRAGGVQ